jgi:hypothetical protein
MRRFPLVLAVLAAALLAPTGALAHSGQTGGTDYQSSITAVPDGMSARIVGGDDRLEITRTTATEVVIMGYGGEPYLRLDATGTWENRNSPAVALNDVRRTNEEIPAATTKIAPDWVQTGTGTSVVFHDHRAHWMASQPPAKVRADPAQKQVLYDWSVPVAVDGTAAEITGDLTWLGAPITWLWWTLLGLAVVVGVLVGLWRRVPVAPAAIAGTVAAVLASVITGVSQQLDVPDSTRGALVGVALGAILLAIGLGLGHRLRAVPAHATTVLLLVALIAGGVQLVGLAGTAFSYALVPGPVPTLLTRVLIIIGIAGVALTAGACFRAWRTLLADLPPQTVEKAPSW